MEKYSLLLLRVSALFALLGTVLGAHMAGAGSPALRPIHAHILVVGWLSLFAWSIYYKVYFVSVVKLAKIHVWTAIIGAAGLTSGMWVHFMNVFGFPRAVTLTLYIGGGVTLLISFFLFVVTTFFVTSKPEA